jgi:hypothetical protein
MSTEDGISFNELLCTTIELILLGLSLIIGATLFYSEKETNSFEYLLSLKYSRIEVLSLKFMPRLLVILFLFLFYLLFKGFLASHPLLLKKIFSLIFFSLFLMSSSFSLIHKNSVLTIILNLLIYVIIALPVVFFLYIMNGFGFERSNIAFLSGFVFFTVFLLVFIFFVLNFRKVDLGNLYTFSYKKGFAKFFRILWGITIVFILLNQIDTGKSNDIFTQKDLIKVNFSRENGFYRLLSLFEPKDVSVESDTVYEKYRRINDPQYPFNGYNYHKTRRKLPQKNLEAIKGEKLMELSPPFSYGIGGWCQFINEREERILLEKEKLSIVLDRYLRLINSDIVDDFTRVDIWPPVPQLRAWEKTGELFLAVSMLEAMTGNWRQGVNDIIIHINFLKKMIKSSRDVTTNLIAKSIMNDSITGLANLMNHQDCPNHVYLEVLDRLKPITYTDYGFRNSIIGEYIAACMEVDQMKRGFRSGRLHEYLLGLFIQKNRTKKILFDYYTRLLEYDKKPPYQWESKDEFLADSRNHPMKGGWFWWFHNPGGKRIARSLTVSPFLLMRSSQTKSLYDMMLIAAELHLKWVQGSSVEEVLSKLKTYKILLDPGSGKPYGYDKNRKLLYSVGMDGKEDEDKEDRITRWNSDFILPVFLKQKIK